MNDLVSPDLLSYEKIYQNCLAIFAENLPSSQQTPSSQIYKATFRALSDFKESYELCLEGVHMTFRLRGCVGYTNCQEACDLIQRVCSLASMMGFTNLDRKQEVATQKRKLEDQLASPSASPQQAERAVKRRALIDPLLAAQKRRRNLFKALAKYDIVCDINALFQEHASLPLSFKSSMAQHQGTRAYMEDAGFIQEEAKGILVGVFDGHCDQGKVANYASRYFQEHFFTQLEQASDQISGLFERLMKNIHENIKELKVRGGTTATVCYIDKSNNYLYTATLGDSQSFVFRKQGECIKFFPVSCVRDWSCLKDATRAVEGLKLYTNDYPFAHAIEYHIYLDLDNWAQAENPKHLRFPPHQSGLNISRTLGDYNNILQWPKIEILSQKPKITEFVLEAGEGCEDCIVIGTDGIWDYVNIENLIEDVLAMHWGKEDLAQRIVDYALESFDGEENCRRDNATAICLQLQACSSLSKSI